MGQPLTGVPEGVNQRSGTGLAPEEGSEKSAGESEGPVVTGVRALVGRMYPAGRMRPWSKYRMPAGMVNHRFLIMPKCLTFSKGKSTRV